MRLRPLLVSAALVGLGASPPAAKTTEDYESIQGSWIKVRWVIGGEDYPVRGREVIRFEGRRYINHGGSSGRYVLDQSKSPREFRISYDSGPQKGRKFAEWYEIKGDKLTFRCTETVEAPPKVGGTKKEAVYATSYFERTKDKQPGDRERPEPTEFEKLTAEANAKPLRDDSKTCPLTLKLSKRTYKQGEPITFTLTITNLTRNPVTVWSSRFWTNHRVTVFAGDLVYYRESPPTELGKRGAKAFNPPNGGRDKNVPREIAAGKSFQESYDIDLTTIFEIGPGTYKLQVIYEDGQQPTPLRTTSNIVAFKIESAEVGGKEPTEQRPKDPVK
jgi:uncharacterized protein (TIGR03067 family)